MASSTNITSLTNQTTLATPTGNTPFFASLNVLFFGKILIATGITLETFNLVVFLHPKMNERKNGSYMNMYLLAKTFCDMYYFLYFLFSQNVMCSSCSGIYAQAWQYVLITTGYFYSIATCLSVTFEFLASFDRYVFISKRFRFYRKVNHKLLIGALVVLSMMLFVFKFFFNTILSRVVETPAGNTTIYSYTFSSFYFSQTSQILSIFVTFYRDGVIVGAIIITNVFVLIEMRKAFKQKMKVTNGTQVLTAKMERAEFNISLMIVFSGILVIMGHIMYFVIHLPVPSSLLQYMLYNLYHFLAVFFAHMHLQCAFFIYFGFNSVFRETFVEILGKLAPKRRGPEPSNANSNFTTS